MNIEFIFIHSSKQNGGRKIKKQRFHVSLVGIVEVIILCFKKALLYVSIYREVHKTIKVNLLAFPLIVIAKPTE